jgi:type II secretory pathway pseudopilin PulG
MHTPPPKRYTASPLAIALLLAAITTLTGCNSCNPNTNIVSEDERTLNVLNKVGSDCTFQTSNGQQSVHIEVKGTSPSNAGNTWTKTLQSLAASTYTVKVPSQGNYKITVTSTEAGGTTTCQPCSSVCGVLTTYPIWKGSDNFTAPSTTLNMELQIPSSSTKSDCGC